MRIHICVDSNNVNRGSPYLTLTRRRVSSDVFKTWFQDVFSFEVPRFLDSMLIHAAEVMLSCVGFPFLLLRIEQLSMSHICTRIDTQEK